MARTARKLYVDPMAALYAEYRRHPIARPHFNRKVRGKGWWFEVVLGAIDGGYILENYRTLAVTICQSGGRDWEGSAYKVQLAFIRNLPDGGGWEWNGVTYSTLLRAVRAYLASEG